MVCLILISGILMETREDIISINDSLPLSSDVGLVEMRKHETRGHIADSLWLPVTGL